MYISEKDIEFAKRTLSDFVNGQMSSPKVVALQMSKDHRYLQQEMFKICFEYMKVLAHNYENGMFDARNEWACEISHKMLESIDQLPNSWDLDYYSEFDKTMY